MKHQDLKYWLLAQNVTNILMCFVFTTMFNSNMYGQEINKCAYRIMGDIIAQDTVIPEYKFKMLGERVRLGKLTKEDSVKYVHTIRSAKMLLYELESNKTALRLLKEDLNTNGKITSYLSEALVRKIMERLISIDGHHNKFLMPSNVNLISKIDDKDVYHKFSSAVKMDDNRYIFYHYKYVSVSNKTLEFIVFTRNEHGECQIEKEIVLYHH